MWVAAGRGKGSFHVFALDFVVSADLQVRLRRDDDDNTYTHQYRL
jgi:hypothetical protein